MHIKHVKIENVRRFGQGAGSFDLDLPTPGWVVLAGRNGSGKTTVLESIALSLLNSFPMEYADSLFSWMRNGAKSARSLLHLEVSPDDQFNRAETQTPPTDLPDTLVIGDDWNTEHGASSHGRESHQNFAFAGPWSPTTRGWFSAGYGAHRRLVGHAAAAETWMGSQAREAAFVTLFREDASLVHPVRWLIDTQYQSVDETLSEPERASAQRVVEVVVALLNAGLIPDVEVVGVSSRGLRVRQGSHEFSLQQLGAGARTVVALVVDLVRNLFTRFGAPNVARQGESAQILSSGVVLIDEVEAHLHVSWQQRIGFWFKRHFPNIQFIVATHSPFVCQAADPGGLIRLAPPPEKVAAEVVDEDLYRTVVNGSVDEAVMSALFGLEHTHSDRSEMLRSELAALEVKEIRGRLSDKEGARVRQIRALLPDTGDARVDRVRRRSSSGR